MASNSLRIRLRIERAGDLALHWFSARLRFAILTDSAAPGRYLDSVILLRAPTRQTAFAQALAQGQRREQSYRSDEGVGVRWRLARVVSLDELPDGSLHGAEVLAMPLEQDEDDAALTWDQEFQPEHSLPQETLA